MSPGDTHSIQVRGANGNCTLPAVAVAVVMKVDVRFEAPAGTLTVVRVNTGRYRVTFARAEGAIPDWEVMAVVSGP